MGVLMSRKSIIQLLFDGVDAGEIVTAIEKGKARGTDLYAREDQVPKGKDKQDLLDQIAFHLEMSVESDQNHQQLNHYSHEYWFHRPPRDCGDEIPHAVDRFYLDLEPKEKASKPKQPKVTGSALNQIKLAKYEEQKEKVRELCIPYIEGEEYTHNIIAQLILDSGEIERLSIGQIRNVVKAQCDAMQRGDLVKGRKK
jgi:hypothetical protein